MGDKSKVNKTRKPELKQTEQNKKKKLNTGSVKKIVGGAKTEPRGGWDGNHNEIFV